MPARSAPATMWVGIRSLERSRPLQGPIRLLALQPRLRGFGVEERLRLAEDLVLPGVVGAPFVRRDHGGAGGARADEQVEPEGQDRALHIEVVRLASGVAQRKVAEDEARYGAVLDDIARAAEQNGRDAVGFQVPR